MIRAAIPLLFALLASQPLQALDARVLDSVVGVLPDWPGYGRARGPQAAGRHLASPEGSGVALFEGGYVVTNDHVLGRAATLRVRLNDGRVLPGEIVGRDAATDIALIKVPVSLPVPPNGPRPSLGSKVCAIGNQFGLGLSLTCGIVSAERRSNAGFNEIEDFIQTDATVNPGGSGGALIDGEGRLAGMVSAIFTKTSDANIGVNFASSLDLVRRVASDLKEYGAVRRADMPFEIGPLPRPLAEKTAGAFIVKVERDGAALRSGVEAGDVLTHVNGVMTGGLNSVRAAIFLSKPGRIVTLTVWRDGAVRNIPLRLSAE